MSGGGETAMCVWRERCVYVCVCMCVSVCECVCVCVCRDWRMWELRERRGFVGTVGDVCVCRH